MTDYYGRPESELDPEVRAAAKAMMRSLCKRKNYAHGCLLNFIPKYPENVVLRGHVDLTVLAEVALEAAAKIRKSKLLKAG